MSGVSEIRHYISLVIHLEVYLLARYTAINDFIESKTMTLSTLLITVIGRIYIQKLLIL